jgi:hypothetical protein
MAFEQSKPLPPGTTVLRRGNTRTTLLVPDMGILKIFRHIGTRAAARSLFLPSDLTIEYDMTVTAASHGIPVPDPIFCAERRFAGILRGAALMFRIVPDTMSLEDVIRRSFPRPGYARQPVAERRRWFAEYGRLFARLHRAGGVHGDPSPDNILIDSKGIRPLVLIDWSFALFVNATVATGPIGRRLLSRKAVDRYGANLSSIVLRADKDGEPETKGSRFASLWRADVARITQSLILFGTPPDDIAICLRAYSREAGFGPEQNAELLRLLNINLVASIRKSMPRTLRNACQSSRKIEKMPFEAGTVYYRREFSRNEIEAALTAPQAGVLVIGQPTERRLCSEATSSWRNACLLARFNLPARRHIACWVKPGKNEVLLLEHSAHSFRQPTEFSPRRLAGFVRVFHAFGLRFRYCSQGTIVEWPGPGRAVVPRHGAGYVLDDVGAVAYAPDDPMDKSTDVVVDWVRCYAGEKIALAFRMAANRRLRFRL